METSSVGWPTDKGAVTVNGVAGTSNRERILETASMIFSTKGVKEATLGDIAAGAGISKGTLYYYYSTKEALVFDVAARHLDLITERLVAWIEQIKGHMTAEQIMTEVLDRFLKAKTRGKLHLYLVQEAAVNADLQERFRAKYDEWRKTMQDGLALVLDRKCEELTALAHIMVAVLDGFTIQGLVNSDTLPVPQIAEHLIQSGRQPAERT